MVYIYGLICPLSGDVRYIGKSIDPQKRFRAHVLGSIRCDYNHHTARWIRSLHREGKYPALRILEAISDGTDWRSVERAWISRALSLSWPLTNSTAGGEGLEFIDPVDELAYRENHRAAMRRFAATEAGKAGISKMKAASMTPEARKRAADTLRKTYKDPVVKERLRKAMAKVSSTPEFKKSKSEGSKRAWRNHRQTIMVAFSTPEVKKKHSDRAKRCWSDPVIRERMMNRWTPEARALQAQRSRELASKMVHPPEGRERQRQAMREWWAKRKQSA